MTTGMNSQQFQYQNYTPAEFEQFRNAVQADGFTVTQNTIDSVSGHIGSLTYITGSYNRNQNVLTVTVKTSPWQSFRDNELENNVKRVVSRTTEVKEAEKVNPIAVKTPPAQTIQPLGTNKNIVQPAVPLKTSQTPVPDQIPKSVETKPTEPVKVAAPTPTK